MNHAGARTFRRRREGGRALGVDRVRQRRLGLGALHRRVGGGVDYDVRPSRLHRRVHGIDAQEVELGPCRGQEVDGVRSRAPKRGAELSVAPGEEDGELSLHASSSSAANASPRASLSDNSGRTPGEMGQVMARSGSSHRIVRS